MTDHVKIKHKIKAIADVRDFESLLRVSMLSEEDKELLRLYYVNGKNFAFVADTLGYSETYIKKRHKAAILKLNKLF